MPIRSHTIPRFYLEQFATSSPTRRELGELWVYERGKEPVLRSTKVQGAENSYFGVVRADGRVDESLESQLARLEAECNDVLVCSQSDLFDWSSSA